MFIDSTTTSIEEVFTEPLTLWVGVFFGEESK
jgi:hypothetical protein